MNQIRLATLGMTALLGLAALVAFSPTASAHPCPVDSEPLAVCLEGNPVTNFEVICVYAYLDDNGNGEFDHGEQLTPSPCLD